MMQMRLVTQCVQLCKSRWGLNPTFPETLVNIMHYTSLCNQSINICDSSICMHIYIYIYIYIYVYAIAH